MIRNVAPDELEWFLAHYYASIGHPDPRGLAHRAIRKLNIETEAARSFILLEGERPRAGAYLKAPEPDADDQNLFLSSLWFDGSPAYLSHLVGGLLQKHPHEAAHFPLLSLTPERTEALTPVFEGLGFALEEEFELAFELVDLPPLGVPLVLEAWSPESEETFREVYAAAEGEEPSDEAWAYLKRLRGPFVPDLWFVARETLDQFPVGYAFYGMQQGEPGVEGIYSLSKIGVSAAHRGSSEMLKRLALSSMHELAAQSPLGSIRTTVNAHDPKLIRIFEGLGFVVTHQYRVFTRVPR